MSSGKDFKILSPLIKFDSRPAAWRVRLKIKKSKRELEIHLDSTSALLDFEKVREQGFEQTNHLLPNLSGKRWKGMLRKVTIETKQAKK